MRVQGFSNFPRPPGPSYPAPEPSLMVPHVRYDTPIGPGTLPISSGPFCVVRPLPSGAGPSCLLGNGIPVYSSIWALMSGPEVFQASAAADVFQSGAVGSSCRMPKP